MLIERYSRRSWVGDTVYIIVRGKKINKEQAYDILLDFDIKNIDDNNDKYCFFNWLDRNLNELIVDTCGNVGNNQYIYI